MLFPRMARLAVLKRWRTVWRFRLKLLSGERNCAASVARAAGRCCCCWERWAAAARTFAAQQQFTLLLYSALLLSSSGLAGTLSTGSTCRTRIERRLILFLIKNYVCILWRRSLCLVFEMIKESDSDAGYVMLNVLTMS